MQLNRAIRISTKVTGIFSAIIIAALLTMAFLFIVQKQAHERDVLTNKGKTMAKLLASDARLGIYSGNMERLKEAAADFIYVREVVFVGVYDENKAMLYRSDPAYPGSSTLDIGESGNRAVAIRPNPSLHAIDFVKPVVFTRKSDAINSLYFDTNNEGGEERVIGYVKIVLSEESLNKMLYAFGKQSVIVAVVFACISIVVVLLWVSTITQPLEKLTKTIIALGKGQAVPQVPVQRSDEIGTLTEAFNTMLIERRQAEQALGKILMDLHDGIGGITTNIGMLSEVAKRASRPEDVTRALTTISNLARDGMTEIRSLMYSLDQQDLNWTTLSAEMRNRGTRTLEPHRIAFAMSVEIEEGQPQPVSLLCLHLLRIYHESLTNVIKHAQATRVEVSLQVKQERLTLRVRDNGVGCATTVFSDKGRGIANIAARAAEIGGSATITGEEGTCVSVELPLVIQVNPVKSS